jgi:hypothetical protein
MSAIERHKLVYCGPYPEVVLEDGTVCRKGEPVELDKGLAITLLEQQPDDWTIPKGKPEEF